MMAPDRAMIHAVNLTEARNLSRLYTEAVRDEHPVLIRRGRDEQAVLLSRDQLLALLASYIFTVHVIPEEEIGGFTLWIDELNLGEYGATLREARDALLSGVRSYVRHFWDQWDFYQHLRDKAEQYPYILRLSLALDDAELKGMLFVPVGEASSVSAHAT
jgi:hypothetical protein